MKCSLTFEIRVASGVESEGYLDIKVKVKKDLFQKVPWVWLLSSGVDYNSIHRKPRLYHSEKDRVLEFSLLGSQCLMESGLRNLLKC